MYTSCTLCGYLTTVHHDMNLQTFNCILLLILAASASMDDVKIASWGTLLVAALAMSQWTNWHLRCCNMLLDAVSDKESTIRHNYNPLLPCSWHREK
jgi:hypothetical protein